MIELQEGMDERSRDIVRVFSDGRKPLHIGFLQWHESREPHITVTVAFEFLTLDEAQKCIDYYQAVIAKRRKGHIPIHEIYG